MPKHKEIDLNRVSDEIRKYEPQFNNPGLFITQTTCVAYITAMP